MLRPLLVSFASLTVITGLAYPLAFTGVAQVLFPRQAQGSLLVSHGQVKGSLLVAQATEDPRYFWSRPSATGGFPTNPGASGGSYQAPSNPALAEAVAKRAEALRAADPGNTAPIPQDLLTASASGLDPHVSLEGALWQVPRVAKARNQDPGALEALVRRHAEGGTLVPPYVNVRALNGSLDGLDGR